MEKDAREKLDPIDHLIYVTLDLEEGIQTLYELLGIRATYGGMHPDFGTCNALISLGEDSYLEIMAPDPQSSRSVRPRPFGIDTLQGPRLASWAVKASQLDPFVAEARRKGIPLGEVIEMHRELPSGQILAWKVTDLLASVADGIVPLFIDWGNSPHPALSAAPGARLLRLRATHPDAERVGGMLRTLGLSLPVTWGRHPALIATLDSPKGIVELY